jgi:hypothetical protein
MDHEGSCFGKQFFLKNLFSGEAIFKEAGEKAKSVLLEYLPKGP